MTNDKIVVAAQQIESIRLTTKSIKGSALSLQSIDNIEGSNSLALGVFSVGNRVTDHVFQESLEHSTGFFVDETRDTLDTSSSGKSSDGWLGDTLDVVTQDFTVTLGTSLS
jgi:hypothetical protein